MTNKEAVSVLLQARKILSNHGKASVLCEGIDKAVQALRDAECYRWHYLADDPNDKPKKDEMVLTKLYTGCECYQAFALLTDKQLESKLRLSQGRNIVAAWKYISEPISDEDVAMWNAIEGEGVYSSKDAGNENK